MSKRGGNISARCGSVPLRRCKSEARCSDVGEERCNSSVFRPIARGQPAVVPRRCGVVPGRCVNVRIQCVIIRVRCCTVRIHCGCAGIPAATPRDRATGEHNAGSRGTSLAAMAGHLTPGHPGAYGSPGALPRARKPGASMASSVCTAAGRSSSCRCACSGSSFAAKSWRRSRRPYRKASCPPPTCRISRRCTAKSWVIYCKPPFGSPEQVLAYLARYTHRVAWARRPLML
jgi:hypothetical protein